MDSFPIPKVLLEGFATQPRIIVKPIPGIWPVDVKFLKGGFLDKAAADKDFEKNWRVMIVPNVSPNA
jgi:hypothetical protein